jgi:hypothetical protein
MILDFEWVPNPGDEAATAMKCLRRLVPLLPGAQGLVYDMAPRGVHLQEVLQLGLIPIVKVHAKQAGAKTKRGRVGRIPKDRHVEDRLVRLADGTSRLCRLHARDGAIGLALVKDNGDVEFVELNRVRTYRKPSRNGYRWYNSYALPSWLGGGGTVTIRLDQTEADVARGFNRTENIRVIPRSDPDFRRLFGLRQDAESINRAHEDSLYLRRAHSLGHSRQMVDFLGWALSVNSLALYLYKGDGDQRIHLA